MSILERVNKDLAAAMKAREMARLNALRLVKAALVSDGALAGRALTGEEEARILRQLIKQREEAAQQYRAAGRAEPAAQEEAERALIAAYLPAEVPEEKVREMVEQVVAETGASGPREMGKVMKVLMPRLQELGSVDGKKASEMVRARLGR